MDKLFIERLKCMYENIVKAIDVYNLKGSCEYRNQHHDLETMCRMIISSQEIYSGIGNMEVWAFIDDDMRFVTGLMSDDEERQHIKFHHDVIEHRKKEIREYDERIRQ